MTDWNIDYASLYGGAIPQYKRSEVFESPDGQYAVVMYGIDEVGASKEAGRVAVFRNKAHPELLFRADDRQFWYLGASTVGFDASGRFATLHEFGSRGPKTRTIDLLKGCVRDGLNPMNHPAWWIPALMGLAIPVLAFTMPGKVLEDPMPGGRSAMLAVFRDGILWSLLPMTALALFLWILRRRIPRWIEVLAFSMMLDLLLGPIGYVYLNFELDRASPQTHRVAVLKKRQDWSDIGTASVPAVYLLTVQSWRPSETTKTIEVREDVFRLAVPGRTWIEVRVRPGFLGHPWIERPSVADLATSAPSRHTAH